MSYSSQAALSIDENFISRISAAAAKELEPADGDPNSWARTNIWWIAAAPGFAEAYESALAAGVPQPGDDPSVISDAQILSAVQAQIAATTPPEEPAP